MTASPTKVFLALGFVVSFIVFTTVQQQQQQNHQESRGNLDIKSHHHSSSVHNTLRPLHPDYVDLSSSSSTFPSNGQQDHGFESTSLEEEEEENNNGGHGGWRKNRPGRDQKIVFDFSQTYTSLEEMDGKTSRSTGRLSKKQPSTVPDFLPSDPYANYTLLESLDMEDYDDDGDDDDDDDDNSDSNLGVNVKIDVDEQDLTRTTSEGILTDQQQQKKSRSKKIRTIVVGDIHGSLEGMNRFLKHIDYNPHQDTIILAGDIVAKGPDSLGVIDRAQEIGAKCVRGNHDDKVIRWYGYLSSLTVQEQSVIETDFANFSSQDEKQQEEDEEEGEFSSVPTDLKRDVEHYQIAKKLSKQQYHYMVSCPLILSIPSKVSIYGLQTLVIHAGIDPRYRIEKQKPWVLVNVRNLLKDGTPSRKTKKGDGWAKIYNQLQGPFGHRHHGLQDEEGRRRGEGEDEEEEEELREEGKMIVYGHDAKRSLSIRPWTIGLDSGCVYGRELSGYVVETGKILSVNCPDYHLDSGDEFTE